MVIYILINYPKESFEPINKKIQIEDIKDKINKEIISKIYSKYSEGKTGDILSEFEDENIINYLSGIMTEDFGIIDINKCIDDLLTIYNKEKLVNEKNKILKKLENTENMNKEEIKNLEENLNDIIIKLAKIK